MKKANGAVLAGVGKTGHLSPPQLQRPNATMNRDFMLPRWIKQRVIEELPDTRSQLFESHAYATLTVQNIIPSSDHDNNLEANVAIIPRK